MLWKAIELVLVCLTVYGAVCVVRLAVRAWKEVHGLMGALGDDPSKYVAADAWGCDAAELVLPPAWINLAEFSEVAKVSDWYPRRYLQVLWYYGCMVDAVREQAAELDETDYAAFEQAAELVLRMHYSDWPKNDWIDAACSRPKIAPRLTPRR